MLRMKMGSILHFEHIVIWMPINYDCIIITCFVCIFIELHDYCTVEKTFDHSIILPT